MRLKSFISKMVAVGLVAGCSQQHLAAEAATGTSPRESEGGGQRAEGGNNQQPAAGDSAQHSTSNTQLPTSKEPTPSPSGGGEPAKAKDNLLFRVQFAGTTVLMANTNAAYLTNFSALPETAALGTQLVARVAGLPARLFKADGGLKMEDGKGTNTNSIANSQLPKESETALRAAFAEMLRDGFTLELRGDSNGVTDFAIAAKTADAETSKRWEAAWNSMAKNCSETTKLATKHSGDWLFVAGSKTDAADALGAIQKSVDGARLEAGAVLQGELASSLLPGPVQRSVYGGFDRLKISVTSADQTLKIRGTATYANDLPKLAAPPVVPTNLVTEPVISFTMVREPGAWLEPNSVLRRFLPNPVPDVAWFWGGESSSYQLFMAVPFAGRDAFNTNFGPALVEHLQPLAKHIGTGSVVLDTNMTGIRWRGTPFVVPKVNFMESGTNTFILAETFPSGDSQMGLTPALVERASRRTNLVLYDWEYTQLRFDTWFRIGQLAILLSGHQQQIGGTASLRWIQTVQLRTPIGVNTSTEITQTGPRELSLNRRAPLAFNSIELFWLANWLESTNFPAANFLIPMAE